MTDQASLTRRATVGLGALALAGLAGCGTDSPDTASPADAEVDSQTPTEAGGTATGERNSSTQTDGTESVSETAAEALDLREANVTAVETESVDGGAVRFSVTLYHDDDGEDGYADWWQVETLDGERLGRRELLHPHSTAPFTRSETVEIPDGTGCVVVRGHDQTHGFGGQAMVVTLETGATRAVDQGSDKRSVAGSDCP